MRYSDILGGDISPVRMDIQRVGINHPKHLDMLEPLNVPGELGWLYTHRTSR